MADNPAGAFGVTSAVARRAGALRSPPRIADVQGSGVLAQCPFHPQVYSEGGERSYGVASVVA